MVKLHIKKGDDSQFLCETTVDIIVDELLTNTVAVYNGRLKVQRICAGLLFAILMYSLLFYGVMTLMPVVRCSAVLF